MLSFSKTPLKSESSRLPIIKAKNLSIYDKKLDLFVLKKANFLVQESELFVFLGEENLRVLCRDLSKKFRPIQNKRFLYSGSLKIQGLECFREVDKKINQFSFTFLSFWTKNFSDFHTIFEHFYKRYREYDSSATKSYFFTKVTELFKLCGILEDDISVLNGLFSQLNSPLSIQVRLAYMLINQPTVLWFENLDYFSTVEKKYFLLALKSVQKKYTITVLMHTARSDFAQCFADKIAFFYGKTMLDVQIGIDFFARKKCQATVSFLKKHIIPTQTDDASGLLIAYVKNAQLICKKKDPIKNLNFTLETNRVNGILMPDWEYVQYFVCALKSLQSCKIRGDIYDKSGIIHQEFSDQLLGKVRYITPNIHQVWHSFFSIGRQLTKNNRSAFSNKMYWLKLFEDLKLDPSVQNKRFSQLSERNRFLSVFLPILNEEPSCLVYQDTPDVPFHIRLERIKCLMDVMRLFECAVLIVGADRYLMSLLTEQICTGHQ